MPVAFPENRLRTSFALRIAEPIRPAEREEPDRRQAEPTVVAQQQVEGVDRRRLLVEVDPLPGRRAPLRPVAPLEVVPRPAELAVRRLERAERGVVGREQCQDRDQRTGQEEEERRPGRAIRSGTPSAATSAAAGSSNVAASAAKNPHAQVPARRHVAVLGVRADQRIDREEDAEDRGRVVVERAGEGDQERPHRAGREREQSAEVGLARGVDQPREQHEVHRERDDVHGEDDGGDHEPAVADDLPAERRASGASIRPRAMVAMSGGLLE